MAHSGTRISNFAISSCPEAANTPAVTSSESPGRKNPTKKPVSTKTMAHTSSVPPHSIRPFTLKRVCNKCWIELIIFRAQSAACRREPEADQPLPMLAESPEEDARRLHSHTVTENEGILAAEFPLQ